VIEGTKRETDAVERHRYHLQRSLGVLAHAAWIYGRTDRGNQWFIRTDPKSIELLTDSGAPIYLTAAQNFEILSRPILGGLRLGGFKAHATGYAYSVGTVPNPDDALLEWHWHPPDLGYTHAHVNVRSEILGNVGRLHLPTSRVFFEQIVSFLIVGLGVEPLDAIGVP
jgi:hypothetical protein